MFIIPIFISFSIKNTLLNKLILMHLTFTLIDFERTYKRLDVKLVERGESFYQDRMRLLIDEMQKNGLLIDDNGRAIYFPQDRLVPLTLVKNDGGFTYKFSHFEFEY